MNDERRKWLANVIGQLEEAKSELEEVLAEEEDAFGNLPESIQEGEQGQKAQTGIEALESAVEQIGEAIISIEEAKG